jgi:catechol 2,3-dioxygenase-like lactoylglutathione lyase family enzyme
MPEPIHPGVPIRHVHLKVADLDRALGFYRDVLGFELTQRLGRSAANVLAWGRRWSIDGAGPLLRRQEDKMIRIHGSSSAALFSRPEVTITILG